MKPSLKIVLNLLDGSTAEILSPMATPKETLAWFKGMQDVVVLEGEKEVHYFKHSIFSWEIANAEESK